MTLTFRPFEEGDLPALLALWAADSGWGPITEAQWRRWYRDTPFGDAVVVVGLASDGSLGAQITATPAPVRVDGRVVRGARLSAPILRQDLRRLSLTDPRHPARTLPGAGLAAAREAGFAVTFSLPDHAWVVGANRVADQLPGLPRHRVALGCLTREPGSPPAAAGLRGEIAPAVADLADECADLWAEAVAAWPVHVGVERVGAWIPYHLGGHLTVAVRDGAGTLVGYVAVNRRSGLVADLAARTPDLMTDVLAAALAALSGAGAGAGVPPRLAIMDTPAHGPAARAAGFVPADFRFAFVCDTLVPDEIPLEALAPSRWYLAGGD